MPTCAKHVLVQQLLLCYLKIRLLFFCLFHRFFPLFVFNYYATVAAIFMANKSGYYGKMFMDVSGCWLCPRTRWIRRRRAGELVEYGAVGRASNLISPSTITAPLLL